jgi:hypothetical protein
VVLSNIDSLSYEYIREVNPDGTANVLFRLNYGTIPKERTLSPNQMQYYYLYNACVQITTNKAVKMFPHNTREPEEYPEDYLPPPPPMIREWSLQDINILLNQPAYPDSIIVEFSRITGSYYTSAWLYCNIGKLLQNELTWQMRKNYVALKECVVNTYADDCGWEMPDHITQYVFDDMISYELCKFII